MDSTPSLENQEQNEQVAEPFDTPKLTPEQEQELKLRSKYPNPQKPAGSSFIQKMLNKGVRFICYFL